MNKNKSVAILLATYNGEKYLVDQIESILSQKNVNVQILVRDDGSIDSRYTSTIYASRTIVMV